MQNVSSTTPKIKIMLSIPYDLRNKNKKDTDESMFYHRPSYRHRRIYAQ